MPPPHHSISITGFVVLAGRIPHIPDPNLNYRNAFEGTTNNGNDLASALVNIVFSYTGYSNAFNVVNEIKRPIPVIKRYGSISVLIVFVLYLLCNVAYFAAVPKDEFAMSGEIAASVFFTAVFRSRGAETALNVLVLLSAFGNLLAVLIGSSRMIREIGRYVSALVLSPRPHPTYNLVLSLRPAPPDKSTCS